MRRRDEQRMKKEAMEQISGTEALKRAEYISRTGGSFHLYFFPYSRKSANPETVSLKVMENCICRTPLPHDRFDIDGKNYFLFSNAEGQPKACYRVLIRYIAFSDEEYKLKKVIWYG